MRRVIDWLFRDRTTGAITIGQWPNPPLWAFVVLSLVEWIVAPGGLAGLVLRILVLAALAIWAIDEVARGVNPWRRGLGGAVLAGVVWNLAQTVG